MTLTSSDTTAQTLHTIWTRYLDQMLTRRTRLPSWMRTHFLSWITTVATHLYQEQQTIFALEHLQSTWLPHRLHRFLFCFANGLITGLITGSIGCLIAGLSFGLIAGMITGSIVGIVFGLIAGLGRQTIEIIERISWTWTGFGSGVMRCLLPGLIVSVIGGWDYSLSFILGFGLISGLSRSQVIDRDAFHPNRGTWLSARNGLIFGLVFGVTFGIITGFIAHSITDLNISLITGLITSSIIGLITGLFFGLGAFLSHFLLRVFLALSHVLPWQLVPFLDEAARRLILYKVGGHYIFIHRLLRDHLASLSQTNKNHINE